ncbi:AMP-binding domain protein [Lasiodiplodia theobromae]|uniref:AMP-binding domain protein n=1 Tax=Lasiodiplodia theobromae TaxID=45133 RepID=UPI0015C3F9CD|nr:AMP-binding domain protein [Lasiodiplodia theobromae]KAF4538010.1 AMP-binding domain protein [Lasiodiplodia theobromae]
MPYLSPEYPEISTKDILSWGLDDGEYDQDKLLWVDALDPSRSVSAKETRAIIRQLVAGFKKAGLKPGDTVCITSFSDIYYSVLVLGIIAAGCVFTGTNPGYTPFELEHHLRASRVKMVISEPDLLPAILATPYGKDLLAQQDDHRPRVLIFDHHVPLSTPTSASTTSHPSWRTLLQHGSQDWHRLHAPSSSSPSSSTAAAANATTTAMLLFSSGTSGLPKPVPLTHANLIAQHTLAFYHVSPNRNNQHLSSAPPWRAYARRISFLPPFHAAIAPSLHVGTLRSGDTTYVMPRFDPAAVLRAICAHAITDVIVVPPCVLALVNLPPEMLKDPRCSLASVRWIRCGAAPLSAGVQARLQALLDRKVDEGGAEGQAVITQVWGMTETACVVTQFAPGERDDGPSGAVGRPLAGLDVKVVDEDGKEVGEGGVVEGKGRVVRGEICVRGPTVVMGYVDVERGGVSRAEWDEEGFFHTGDVVEAVDKDDGKGPVFWIVDRKKELIKVRGFQVAPPEVEGVLLAHPDVLDAAVIGVFDTATQSEVPRAYIMKRAGASLTVRDVKQWVSERLAKYKCLDGGVVFLDVIPKTASGKILKRVLREMAKREMGKESKL